MYWGVHEVVYFFTLQRPLPLWRPCSHKASQQFQIECFWFINLSFEVHAYWHNCCMNGINWIHQWQALSWTLVCTHKHTHTYIYMHAYVYIWTFICHVWLHKILEPSWQYLFLNAISSSHLIKSINHKLSWNFN